MVISKVEAYKDNQGILHSTEDAARRANLAREADSVIDEIFPRKDYGGFPSELKWSIRGGNYDKLKELVKRFDELSMQFDEYQKEVMKNKVYGYGDSIIYPTLGLANEAGEVAGKVKKVLRDSGGNFDEENKRKIADELGDVLWYLAAVAEDLGLPLSTIAQMNITKLTDRRNRGVIKGSGDNR